MAVFESASIPASLKHWQKYWTFSCNDLTL